MDVPVFPEKVAQQLKEFARQCMDNPSLLHDPKLSFIKELIEHYGGKVPETTASDSSSTQCGPNSTPEESQPEPEPKPEPAPEPESEESDVELDMTGVIGSYVYFLSFSLREYFWHRSIEMNNSIM